MSLWTPKDALTQEPHKVLLKRGEFIDDSREQRIVPYKIYHPVDHALDNVPVILWSHGFGGNRDGASFLSRFIASHGYIIVHLTHSGTDSSLWEGKDGHPWDILKNVKISRQTTLDRMFDVPFALDQLNIWAQENQDIGAFMDLSRVGMSGHSFGAMTTQVMAGMRFPNADRVLNNMRDDRIIAGILYSPVPIGHITDAHPDEIYGPIEIPLFHMTGTEDDSPLDGYDYKHRLIIRNHARHEEQYLQVLNDGDHMVYNGTRGKLANNPNRGAHEDEIKAASLAFWNAYLKDDERASAWLQKEAMIPH